MSMHFFDLRLAICIFQVRTDLVFLFLNPAETNSILIGVDYQEPITRLPGGSVV